jgi:hypothetical protein
MILLLDSIQRFGFILGVRRLVFDEAMPASVSEGAPVALGSIPERAAENADVYADILVEIAKQQGGAAIRQARALAKQLRALGGGKLADESQAKFADLVKRGQGTVAQVKDPAHGLRHMQNVFANAMEIQKELEIDHLEVNSSIADVAAIWHDTGRFEDPAEHETLSALWAHNEALKTGFSLETATKIFDAIYHHKWSDKPKTLEGNIVRDADKLDFLDGERWRKRLEGKKYDELEYVTGIFLNLREKGLELDASKRIFDKRLPAFLDFIEKVDDKIFDPLKKQILSRYGGNMN